MKVNSVHKSRSVFMSEWLGLAAALLVSGSLLAVDAYRDYDAALAAESERALATSQVVQLSIDASLKHADNVILALRQEILEGPLDARLNVRLQTLALAMPMIRTLTVHDVNGTIVATSRSEILGVNQNFMALEYFKKLQQGVTDALFIPPPFLTSAGSYTVMLLRKFSDKRGALAGVIAATLDPGYFLPLLDSVRYADDSVASLQRSAGVKAAIWVTFSLLLITSLWFHQRRVRRITLREAQAGEAPGKSERFMRTITNNIPGLIAYWNADMRCMFSNAAYEVYFGKTTAQMAEISAQELLGESLFAKNEKMILAALRGEPQQFERTLTKPDGSFAYIWAQYVPDVHNGRVHGFFVLESDITDLKRAEVALLESMQLATTTIDTVPETICVLDKTGVIIAVNQAWRDFYDANCDDPQSINYALGTNYLRVCESAAGADATEAPLMAQGLAAVLAGERELFSLEYPCDSPTEKRFFFARVKRFIGDSGHVLVAHGNITERKMLELKLACMAHTDVLTGLNNRRHFIELSEIELSRTSRQGGALSVLMIDIDHFKRVNDTHGHQVGDAVIQMLAAVCREQLRDLDVIGRLGGEEFAVTMPNTDHAQAMQVAERLCQAIEAASVPLLQGLPVRFTASIGVTTLPNDLPNGPSNLDTLIDQADRALYKAKNNGRNQVCGFVDTV